MNLRLFIAATGDIKRSKKASEEQLEFLPIILEKINTIYQPVVPFSIQAGDEIQGLLSIDSKPFKVLLDFIGEIFPLDIRWGIGLGSITTPIHKTTANMRGEVFEFSRKALGFINKKRSRFHFHDGNNVSDEINVILALISGYLNRWDNKTYRRYKLYTKYGTIYKVAELENVSIEAINKYLHRQGIREIKNSIQFLNDILHKHQPN